MDAAVEGMPAVYEIGGREYIVFCAAAQATTRTHDVPGHPAPASADPRSVCRFCIARGCSERSETSRPLDDVSRAVRLIHLWTISIDFENRRSECRTD